MADTIIGGRPPYIRLAVPFKFFLMLLLDLMIIPALRAGIVVNKSLGDTHLGPLTKPKEDG